eukprot:1181118-Prorocentrum_minimum.AAC.3
MMVMVMVMLTVMMMVMMMMMTMMMMLMLKIAIVLGAYHAGSHHTAHHTYPRRVERGEIIPTQRAPIVEGETEYTHSGHQSQKERENMPVVFTTLVPIILPTIQIAQGGRENIPTAGTNRRKGEREYARSAYHAGAHHTAHHTNPKKGGERRDHTRSGHQS